MNILGKIDIVIVNWNAGNLLKRCVESVLNSDNKSWIGKIIIVDNASTDDSLEILPANEKLKILINEENKGFAFACNQGIEICDSEFVVMLNPDVILRTDTLRLSAEYMVANSDTDIMGCMQHDDNGHVSPACSRFPTPIRFWNDALALSKLFPSIFKPATLMTDWNHLSSRLVDQIIGSYLFIRSTVFDRIGYFDTRFFVYYEELDLSKRLAEAGGNSYYNHTISLIHSCNGTTEKIKAFRLFLSLNSRLLYSQKHFNRLGHWSVFIVTTMVEPFTRMIFALLGRNKANIINTWKGSKMIWAKWFFGKQILNNS